MIEISQGMALVLVWIGIVAGMISSTYLIVTSPMNGPRHLRQQGEEDARNRLLPLPENPQEPTVEFTLGSNTDRIAIVSVGPITPRPYTIPRKCGLCEDGISPLSGEPCVWCSGSTFRPLRLAPKTLLPGT